MARRRRSRRLLFSRSFHVGVRPTPPAAAAAAAAAAEVMLPRSPFVSSPARTSVSPLASSLFL
uniref:Uncharacterized protein n=1 Tax=Arundo donax TaxID=35708 RepID=A0A0A9DHI4_ARUDO